MNRYVLFALLIFPASAATFRVPSGAGTIQGAINAAADGDEILVEPGAYNENVAFGSKSVRVQSTRGAAVTILSGRGNAAVVTFAGGAGSVIGFTIQGGGGATPLDEGGGISVTGGTPVIADNIIQNNRVSYAGGGIGIVGASPTIRNNVIRNNSGGNFGGGGISVRGAGAAVITNNVIRDNQSTVAGGAISLLAVTNPLLQSNIIANNRGGDAGAIYIVSGGNPLIVQNLITGNTGAVGGIINPQGSFINNTIADNTGTLASALGALFAVNARFVNNIFSNSAGGVLISCAASIGSFRANLLFAPGGSITAPCPEPTREDFNAVVNPQFVCPGDYRLRQVSPAVDSGDPTVTTPAQDLDYATRTVGSAIDRGAFEFGGPSKLDFSSSSLVFDDVVVGRASSPRSFTISNTGTQRAAFCTEVDRAPEYQLASSCGASLDPGQACSVGINFRPVSDGVRTGAVNVFSNAAPASVALRGIGLNPVAALDTISPSSTIVGAGAFTLEVRGSSFTPSSVVQWNGNNRPTTYVNAALLKVAIPASDVAAGGKADVRVVNPAPGGGASTVQVFPIHAPALTDGALRNGANYSLKLAAGSYAALFGNGMAGSSSSAQAYPLPTTLNGVNVSMNGFAAPLFYVSPTQINLQIPWELAGAARANLVLTVNGSITPAIRVDLTPLAPALLTENQEGVGQGAILVAGTGLVANTARPANRTEAVEIYALGLGPATGQPASGSPASRLSLTPVTAAAVVEFGGVPGRVLFAGLAPGFVGLYQVNVQLPLNAPVGRDVPVVLKVGGQVSNAVTMAIQ